LSNRRTVQAAVALIVFALLSTAAAVIWLPDAAKGSHRTTVVLLMFGWLGLVMAVTYSVMVYGTPRSRPNQSPRDRAVVTGQLRAARLLLPVSLAIGVGCLATAALTAIVS
jgi:uncharacterized membrane protein